MQESLARSRLELLAAASSEPTLSASEVQQLLDMARVVDVYGVVADSYESWAAGALAAGAKVVPTVRNGHYYTVSGGTAVTEPAWPTSGSVVQDGITYTEAGSAPWLGAWDINRAVAEAWRVKAGKVAGRYAFTSEVNSFQRQQIHDMCLKMAAQYDVGGVGTITVVPGAWDYDPVIGNLNGAV